MENKLRNNDRNVVVTDVRFPNEILSVKDAGGYVVKIKRGNNPLWIDDAHVVNSGPSNPNYEKSLIKLNELGIHYSERNWIDEPVDFTIDNNGSIDELFKKIEKLINDLGSNRLASRVIPHCAINVDS